MAGNIKASDFFTQFNGGGDTRAATARDTMFNSMVERSDARRKRDEEYKRLQEEAVKAKKAEQQAQVKAKQSYIITDYVRENKTTKMGSPAFGTTVKPTNKNKAVDPTEFVKEFTTWDQDSRATYVNTIAERIARKEAEADKEYQKMVVKPANPLKSQFKQPAVDPRNPMQQQAIPQAPQFKVSKEEATKRVQKYFDDEYLADKNTLMLLRDTGLLGKNPRRGSVAEDGAVNAADRSIGALARYPVQAIASMYEALGIKGTRALVDDRLEQLGLSEKQTYSDLGKIGALAGGVTAEGIKIGATLPIAGAAGAATATGVAKKANDLRNFALQTKNANLVKNLDTVVKASQYAGESAVWAGYDTASDMNAGRPLNLVGNAATGLAFDAAGNVVFKGFGAGYQGLKAYFNEGPNAIKQRYELLRVLTTLPEDVPTTPYKDGQLALPAPSGRTTGPNTSRTVGAQPARPATPAKVTLSFEEYDARSAAIQKSLQKELADMEKVIKENAAAGTKVKPATPSKSTNAYQNLMLRNQTDALYAKYERLQLQLDNELANGKLNIGYDPGAPEVKGVEEPTGFTMTDPASAAGQADAAALAERKAIEKELTTRLKNIDQQLNVAGGGPQLSGEEARALMRERKAVQQALDGKIEVDELYGDAGSFAKQAEPNDVATELRAPKSGPDKIEQKAMADNEAIDPNQELKIHTGPPKRDISLGGAFNWMKNLTSGAQKKLADRSDDVLGYVKEVEAITGNKLDVAKNPWQMLKLKPGAEGAALQHLDEHATWITGVPMDIRMDGDLYGYSKQMLAQGDKLRTPQQLAAAQKTLDRLQRQYGPNVAMLDEYMQKVRQTFDTFLEKRVEAGMITRERADELMNAPDYFAKMEVLHDQFSTMGIRSVNAKTQKGLQKIKGQSDDAKLLPSAQAMVAQAERTYNDIANNKVIRAMADAAGETGGKTDIVRLPEGGNTFTDAPTGYTKMSYWRDGELHDIAVADDLAHYLQGVDAETAGQVLRTVGKMQGPLRDLVTTYNPVFVLFRNPARDLKSFAANARNTKAHRALDQYMFGFVDAFTNGKMTGGWTKKMYAAGGGQSTYTEHAGNQAHRQWDRTAKKIMGGPKTKREIAGDVIKSPARFMAHLSQSLENAPRVAEFRNAKKAGLSDEAAAIDAREVTVDYAQGGTLVKELSNIVPFLNARTQGNRRAWQAFKENPKRFISVYTATSFAPIAGLMMWNQQNHRDVWESISEYEKENNFILIMGDEQDDSGRYTNILRVPKGDVDKVLGNSLEFVLDKWADDDWDNFAEGIGGTLLQSASNASPIDFARDGELSGAATLGSLNPAIKAPVEQATNYRFFQENPIVPENPKTAANREDKASWLYKELGKVTGMGTLRAEHLGESFFGEAPADIASGGTSTATRLKNNVTTAYGGETTDQFYTVSRNMGEQYAKTNEKIRDLIGTDDFMTASELNKAQRLAREHNQKIDKYFGELKEKVGAKNWEKDWDDDIASLKIKEDYKAIMYRSSRLAAEAEDDDEE